MKKKFSRRHFIKNGALIATGLTITPSVLKAGKSNVSGNPIRLGAPVPGKFSDPVEWAKGVRSLRYSAAYCPVQPGGAQTRAGFTGLFCFITGSQQT